MSKEHVLCCFPLEGKCPKAVDDGSGYWHCTFGRLCKFAEKVEETEDPEEEVARIAGIVFATCHPVTMEHAREVAKAIRDLEAELGREARDAEIATRMGIDIADYHRIVQDTVACQMTNMDDTVAGEINDHRNDPFADMVDENFRTELTQAISELPEREKLVMSLYYGDDLNLKEIGAVLKVTESRVCQLHGQALARLKARLSSWREQGSAA